MSGLESGRWSSVSQVQASPVAHASPHMLPMLRYAEQWASRRRSLCFSQSTSRVATRILRNSRASPVPNLLDDVHGAASSPNVCVLVGDVRVQLSACLLDVLDLRIYAQSASRTACYAVHILLLGEDACPEIMKGVLTAEWRVALVEKRGNAGCVALDVPVPVTCPGHGCKNCCSRLVVRVTIMMCA